MAKFEKPPIVLFRSRYDPHLFQGLMDECNGLGWRLINLEYVSNYVPPGQTPVGAIIANPPQDSTVDRLRDQGVPIVCISTQNYVGYENDFRLFEDRFNAGQLAVEAFVERGFKQFGFVSFDEVTPDDLTFDGFRDRAEMQDDGTLHVGRIQPTPGPGDSTPTYEFQIRQISDWLKELPMPLGVLAFNYRMAVRVVAACEMAGLSVPEQVAVICRGNNEGLCGTAPVPLSAIDMNREEIGRRSVEILKSVADGNEPSRDIIYIPVKGFVARRSTDILAVPDPVVAKAMRFIWDHMNWPLTVDDVAFEVGTSRATLERSFRRTLGRGMNAELRRKRLEVCKELLRTTKLPLARIAKAVGLSSRRYLHRAFKAAFGLTPQEYRKSHVTKS